MWLLLTESDADAVKIGYKDFIISTDFDRKIKHW